MKNNTKNTHPNESGLGLTRLLDGQVTAWAKIPPALRAAILAIVSTTEVQAVKGGRR